MIRLTLMLGASLFVVMLVGGEDRGQQRFGLVARTASPVTAQSAPAEAAPEVAALALPIEIKPAPAIADLSNAAFVPEKPLMVEAPVVAESQPVAEVAMPEAPARIMTVSASAVNVRGGPGTGFDVTGRLTRGEAVLVLDTDDLPDGWSHILIEGDGIEGYIATRLLTE